MCTVQFTDDNHSKEIVSVKDKMSKVLRACRIVSQRRPSNPPAHIHSEEPVPHRLYATSQI